MRHGRLPQRFISSSFWNRALTAILATALSGCAANRQFEVVSPGPGRGPIAPNAGAVVSKDQIDYELFQFEGSVVVRFVNRTGKPLRLTGQSALIDAAGRAFVVEPQDIGPDESGRLVLPPSVPAEKTRPVSMATEVRVGGIDEGGLIGTRRDVEQNAAGLPAGAAAAPPPGFRWRRGQVVRARLVYQIGEADTLTHDWSLRRSK